MHRTEHPPEYDYPVVTVIQEKIRRARVDHRCGICGNTIPRGTRYRYYFIRDEEALKPTTFSSYQCLWCEPDSLPPEYERE